MTAYVSSAGQVGTPDAPIVRPLFAWLVFALTVGLLLSDYMSRQVLNAVFPLLKAQWGLSDTELGSLSSVVALMVGVLALPLCVLADRWGRVRSVVVMGLLWSLATLGCAISTKYGEMLAARAFVGLGEAAYGSVGVAIALSVFPARLRASLSGIFFGVGVIGFVLGLALGGVVAKQLGWRWSFGVMALLGIVLVIAFGFLITERKIARQQADVGNVAGPESSGTRMSLRALVTALFSSKSIVYAYVGNALHLFLPNALIAWMPSYLNRYFGMPLARAAVTAAGLVLLLGVGMMVCGIVTDRVSRADPGRRWQMSIIFCLLAFALLGIAFQFPVGSLQLALIGVGIFFSAGAMGSSTAIVADLTPEAIHSSAFGTLTLFNNIIGVAPAAVVTGFIADRMGLLGALQIIPLVSLVAVVAFIAGKRSYLPDLSRLNAPRRQVAA